MDAFTELLAFLSGVALLKPAWRVNGVLRQSAELRAILKQSQSQLVQQTVPGILGRLDAVATDWNVWDQRCLRWGAALFALSSFIRLFMAVAALLAPGPAAS